MIRILFPTLKSHTDHAVATHLTLTFGGVTCFERNCNGDSWSQETCFLDELHMLYVGPNMGDCYEQVCIMGYFYHSLCEWRRLGIENGLIVMYGAEDNKNSLTTSNRWYRPPRTRRRPHPSPRVSAHANILFTADAANVLAASPPAPHLVCEQRIRMCVIANPHFQGGASHIRARCNVQISHHLSRLIVAQEGNDGRHHHAGGVH